MQQWLVWVVVVHFFVASWHGLAHQHVPVALSTLQTLFVAMVVMIGPLLGAALSFTRFRARAAAIVCLAMAASGVFGLSHHFLLPSPDHIAWVPPGPWTAQFIHSAFGVLITEALGTGVGAIAWWRWSRTPAGWST